MLSADKQPAPIKVLVVDDEPLARRNLTVLLRRDPDIGSVAECGSGLDAIEEIRRSKPDLLFLDVQMPECGGFDVLELLGGDLPSAIIFVTAYDEYALRAFEAGALDYLLKPFDDARFARALYRAKESSRTTRRCNRSRVERLVVKSRGQVLFLDVADIDWIEAAGYYACLHVGGDTHIMRRTLSELERDLGDEKFIRIHRSIIVNLDRIHGLELAERRRVRGRIEIQGSTAVEPAFSQAASGSSGGNLSKIGRMIDVGDEPGLFRLPVELRAGTRARSRDVDACEHREPAEVLGRLFGRLRDDRNVQAPADHLGDLLERHALFGDRMEGAPLRAALEREPIDAGGVEPVHAPASDCAHRRYRRTRPSRARTRSGAARSRDRRGHAPTGRAGPSMPVRRVPPARPPPPPICGERGRVGRRHILLGRRAARGEERHAGRHEQRTVGAFEHGADRLDGALVLRAVLREFREVVVEGGVDHGIRLGGAAPQAVQIRERAAMNLGARRGERLRSLVRAGQAEHLMAGGDQVLDDGRADPTGCSSDKYTHSKISSCSWRQVSAFALFW